MKRPAPVLSFLILPFLLLSGAAQAQQSGTLEKVQKSGEIAMGVRESSAPLSYTLGAGEFTGYHVELCRAIVERMGLPRKRVRDAGGGVRQGFHRAGDIILEVVERPDLPTAQPASIWGLVLVVDDIDATVAWLGPDAVGSPRDAVQPGRRIASLRREVGLGLAVALMTPHVR